MKRYNTATLFPEETKQLMVNVSHGHIVAPVSNVFGHTFTVYGNPPAKSNCYRIISFKKKKQIISDENVTIWLSKIHESTSLEQVREILAEIEDLDTQKAHYSLAKSTKLKRYEKEFEEQSTKFRNTNINVPFGITITVYFPTKRSDLDNSLKVVLDCLQHCKTINNDNLCMTVLASKAIDKDSPRIEFSIYPYAA